MENTTNPQPTPSSLIDKIDFYCNTYLVQKAPYTLPDNVKEIIVKYGPYASLIVLIFSLHTLFTLLGLNAVLSPFAGYINHSFSYTIYNWFSVITMVISAIALPGLFKRSLKSWRLMFYVSLLQLVPAILTLNLSSLIVSLITITISFYFLFQIKSYYK